MLDLMTRVLQRSVGAKGAATDSQDLSIGSEMRCSCPVP
jgi:hypothetical protein